MLEPKAAKVGGGATGSEEPLPLPVWKINGVAEGDVPTPGVAGLLSRVVGGSLSGVLVSNFGFGALVACSRS